MEGILGQVILFAGNFAPRGWKFCDGQLLPISQFESLFAILGTMYGGDGRTSFGLPDLRGRTPIGAGRAPGLSQIQIGQKGGREGIQIMTNSVAVNTKDADGQVNSLAHPGTPVESRNPFLGMHYIICVSGGFPSRE